MLIITNEVIIGMPNLASIIENYLDCFREKQGNKRKKIDIELFEIEIINNAGSEEKYTYYGGYKEFCRCILIIQNSKILNPIKSCNSSFVTQIK